MQFRQDDASKAERQRPRRSWLAPALGVSLAAHAGLAAMLWIERPAQPKAGVLLGVEIVSMAGAANAGPLHGGPSPARGAPAKPAPAPEASPPPPPDAPRAARAEPQPPPPRAAPSPPPPETAKPPVDELALRLPVRAREASPASAAPAPRAKEIALRKPARIPPPPVAAPRLAGPAAPRAGERAAARAQTAAVPIVAADAAPGAGPENGATPPRYGFGSAANPIPRYPQLARERGWEGVVVLAVQVGAGGEALSVGIAKSSGHGLLDASAVDAVRRWRFEPARRAGIPVAAAATVPIRFRLEE